MHSQETLNWAKETLKITDEKAFAGSKAIVQTPWSSVFAINTGNEVIYLKHMPEQIALEAKIIKQLKSEFNAAVPEVLADNSDLNCFLMKDAGIKLRTILLAKFDIDLMCRAIEQFAKLQIAAGKNVKALLDLGVPDWRGSNLAVSFENLLLQEELLREGGLDNKEISQLRRLAPLVKNLCEHLSSCGIADSIVQPDFQDNNIVFDKTNGKITHIDLGEIVIANPLFSLVGCLYQMQKHHAIQPGSNSFNILKEACLKNFRLSNTEQNILKAFTIAKQLFPIYRAIAIQRLIMACDSDKTNNLLEGKLSQALRWFLASPQ